MLKVILHRQYGFCIINFCNGEITMVKMQIIMDEKKIKVEGKYNISKMNSALDFLFVQKLGFTKGNNGFFFRA
jgi:hypothetical protein